MPTPRRQTHRFHDRQRELALLDETYAQPGGQLFVLYGRRRVGKTELVSHWLETRGHRALAWTADRVSTADLVRSLSHALQAFRNPSASIPPDFSFGTWDYLFREIAQLAESGERLVVVLDEFTYALEADSSLSSVLQRLWDQRLRDTPLMLILTGSHAGMIAREILAYRAPLYHRATRHLHLQPLPYGALHAFFPGFDAQARVSLYGCVGGVPEYLRLVDPSQPLEAGLRRLLDDSRIIDDAAALLRDQLAEPANYASIVKAIAAGYGRLTDIARMAGLADTAASRYLGTLQELGIVAREVPATVSQPERSKMGRYVLADAYLRFYYRFVYPYRTQLARGRTEAAWGYLRQHLPAFLGEHVFEALCREWVAELGDRGKLAFLPRRVGAFWGWGAGVPQIDVVAINEDEHQVLVGECKWTAEPIQRRVAARFLERARSILPAPAERWQVHYVLFSRSGFTREAVEAGTNVAAQWVSLADIDRDLRLP